ncbi:FAD:protein FMN transferase [Candidatus Poribacteria bacterium]|jgi:FAD:protein FMN transferase|nr:FAD:protein FMN transferase [Candidatus Poribacteria bacterium]MBT5534846.1 FAD:protein FMN transferase [Candidatus Poribacteria bacterium]MBT5715151.1 FAD:protein FMN transferase [Candidatus Poribacteria bacterium]MBT7097692.1 FAD:protein FMN transferase [Candidatus Poribacteria bacterium]MBT7807388.1 FAD:protein FMN transferase [Candidatus Poribacteria bacterium]
MMGSFGSVTAYAADASVDAVLVAALDEMQRVDTLMSHYKPDSEVSRISAMAGAGSVRVQEDTLHVVTAALDMGRETCGAFDITVAPLLKLWGCFSHGARVPSATEVEATRADVGLDGLRVDQDAMVVMLMRERMELDLGGIAKGYAVDQAARALRVGGVRSALVNLSNSAFRAVGSPPGEDQWRIAVSHPRAPGEQLGVVLISDVALATSADTEQFFVHEGVRYGHIMDPRTGYPVSNGVVSVTVVAPTGLEADALATAVFVLGPDDGMRLIGERPRTSALVVTEEADGRLKLHVSEGMRERFLPSQVEERSERP